MWYFSYECKTLTFLFIINNEKHPKYVEIYVLKTLRRNCTGLKQGDTKWGLE